MDFDPLDTVALTVCDDDALLAAQASLVDERRRVDARLAAVAGEIARRSSTEAGMAGLAQRSGDRTPEKLIERLTGVDHAEARRLVEIGSRLGDPASPIGLAVRSGTVSVASAAAIAGELARVVGELPTDAIAAAEAELVDAAPGLAVSELRREARILRDELDVAGVPEREERLYQRRRLAFTRQADGMTRVDGLLDPETAALVTGVFDHALSPRRGGPRFVDPADVARAERIEHDPRTTEQLMVDLLAQLIRMASAADDADAVLGTARPQLTVLVTERDLASGHGMALLEGQSAPVSVQTAERLGCGGATSVLLDSAGQVLDLGREQRLFTRRQRRALAARDGGCLAPGCDRPPSWTEAHHIDEWSAHGGRTDLARGVLLCAHHHRWLHASGRRIVSRDGVFGLDDARTGAFVPWPSKNPLLRRLRASEATG